MITANSYVNSKPYLVESEFVPIATKQAEKLYIWKKIIRNWQTVEMTMLGSI